MIGATWALRTAREVYHPWYARPDVATFGQFAVEPELCRRLIDYYEATGGDARYWAARSTRLAEAHSSRRLGPMSSARDATSSVPAAAPTTSRRASP